MRMVLTYQLSPFTDGALDILVVFVCLVLKCLVFQHLDPPRLNLSLDSNKKLHLFHGICCLLFYITTSHNSLKPY